MTNAASRQLAQIERRLVAESPELRRLVEDAAAASPPGVEVGGGAHRRGQPGPDAAVAGERLAGQRVEGAA